MPVQLSQAPCTCSCTQTLALHACTCIHSYTLYLLYRHGAHSSHFCCCSLTCTRSLSHAQTHTNALRFLALMHQRTPLPSVSVPHGQLVLPHRASVVVRTSACTCTRLPLTCACIKCKHALMQKISFTFCICAARAARASSSRFCCCSRSRCRSALSDS